MSRMVVLVDVFVTLGLGGFGVLCAWVMRRYTTLSARNLYAPAAAGAAALTAALAVHGWAVAMFLAPPSFSHPLRLKAALGAGAGMATRPASVAPTLAGGST
jgi:hypothetical protein